MSTTQQTQQSDDLADELFRVSEDTAPDGRVRVEIREVAKFAYPDDKDPEMKVTFRLPSMREITETMPYPERDDPDYKFVRLCHEAGLTLGAIEQLEGCRVNAKQDDDGEWVLDAPERETFKDRMMDRGETALTFGGALFTLAVLPAVILAIIVFGDKETTLSEDLLVLAMATGVWTVLAMFVHVVIVAVTGDPTAPPEVPI